MEKYEAYLPPGYTDPSDISADNMRGLSNVAAELRDGFEEYSGMVVYGSVARGEAGSASDADICVFMKPDETAAYQRGPLQKIQEGELKGTYRFDGATTINYKLEVEELLRRQGIGKSDVDVLPISQEIIDDSVASLTREVEEAAASSEDQPLRVPRNLRMLFHMPVDDQGSRIFLERAVKVLGQKQSGDQAWRFIRHMVLGFEAGKGRPNQSKAPRYLPETLEEARDFYL